MHSDRTKKLVKRQKEIQQELQKKRLSKLNDFCEARRSKIHNIGVFASKDIKKGEYIIEYVGEKISKKESDKRAEKKVNGHSGAVYLFTLNKRVDIDGAVGGNGAHYINHSCDPNCEAIEDDNEIWIAAMKPIKKGTELSYDYGFEYEDDYEEHICKCGSKNCVGYILDRKYWKKLK